MDTTRPIFVLDYVDTPFDEVCDLLHAWEGHRLAVSTGGLPTARVGPVDRIADHVVRVMVFDEDDRVVAELRALAVSTGRESLTELLVVARPVDSTLTGRAMVLERARSILERATRWMETSDRRVLPRRAS